MNSRFGKVAFPAYVVLFSIYIREHIVYQKSHENHNKEGAHWWHGIWSYYVLCNCALILHSTTVCYILFVDCCCSQVPLGISSTTLHRHLICTAMLYYNATETVVLLFTMSHNNVYYNYTERDLSVWSSSVFVLKYHVTVCLFWLCPFVVLSKNVPYIIYYPDKRHVRAIKRHWFASHPPAHIILHIVVLRNI